MFLSFYDVLFFFCSHPVDEVKNQSFAFSKSRTQHTRAIQVSYLNLNTLKSKYFVVLVADCIVNSVFEKQCVFPQMATICVFQFHHHDVFILNIVILSMLCIFLIYMMAFCTVNNYIPLTPMKAC